MKRPGYAASAALMALAGAACSASEEGSPPPVTANEARALAEARAMIPASETMAKPTPEESPKP